MVPAIGSAVKFHRNHPAGEFDAIVIGYEFSDEHGLKEGDLPHVTLSYVEPKRVQALGGANRMDAFETVFTVPHKEVDDEGPNHYSLIAVASPAKPAKEDPGAKKLQAFLLENFKSETGDETAIDCAIRLLSKTKKK